MTQQRHYQAMMAWNALVAQDTTLWALDNKGVRYTYHPLVDSSHVSSADMDGLHEVLRRKGLNVAETTTLDSWPYLGVCGTMMGEDRLDCTESNLYSFLAQSIKFGLLSFKSDDRMVLEFEVSEAGEVERVMVIEAPSEKAGLVFQKSLGECPKMTPAMLDGDPVRVALQFSFSPQMISTIQKL